MSGPPQPNRLTYPDFHPLSGQDLIIVHDHDVLSGRGVNIAQHPGNERFRALVQSRSDAAYCKNYTSSEKKAVAEEIIQHIKRLNPPGRFLKRTGRSKNSRGLHGPWDELTGKEARKKTCQALRDCNRNDREGYAAAVSVPDDVIHSSVARQQTGLSNKEYAEQIAAVSKPSGFVVPPPPPDAAKVQAQAPQPLQALPLPSLQAVATAAAAALEEALAPMMQTALATPMTMISSGGVAAVTVLPATAAASAASNPSPPPPPSCNNPKRSREVSTDGGQHMFLQQPLQFLSPPTTANEDESTGAANSWLKKQRTVTVEQAAAPPNPSPSPPPPPSLPSNFLPHHHMALLHHVQNQGHQQLQSPPSVEVAAGAEWLKQQQQQEQQQLWVHHHPIVNNGHSAAVSVYPESAAAAPAANPSPPPLSNNPTQSQEVVQNNIFLHLPQTEQRRLPPFVEFPAAVAAAAAAMWKQPLQDLAVKPQYAAVPSPAVPPHTAPADSSGSDIVHAEQDTVQEHVDDYAATSFSAYTATQDAAVAADECALSKSPFHLHHYQYANTSLPPSFPPSPATALAAANGDFHGPFDPATMVSIARAFQDEDNIGSVVAAHAPRQDPYFAMGEDPLFGSLHFHPTSFSHNHLAQRRENNPAHNIHKAPGGGGDDEESHSDGVLFI